MNAEINIKCRFLRVIRGKIIKIAVEISSKGIVKK